MNVLFVVLAIGALFPAYWVWRMVIYYWLHSRVTPPMTGRCPKAAVILCLRGADPSLDACLRGLLHQDYPNYQLRIVVDNRSDGAWQKAHDALASGGQSNVDVRVSTLEKHCPNCSLKVCSQLQAIERLDSDVEVVVLIDADSIPAPDWLRALVLALADPDVGAATGMRWFAPLDGGWGSLMRHIYNAGSFPQMFAFDHPWGGSVAIRADIVRRSQLQDRWRRALCEDSAITGPLRQMGLKLVYVPGATNINQESITYEASYRFIQRQLLCVRLDHVDWPILLACNTFNTLCLTALTIVAVSGAMLQRWDWLGFSSAILAAFAFFMFAPLPVAELVIRRNHRKRGLVPPPMVWTWRMVPAFFFTHFVSMKLLWQAQFLRRVAWRGIHYSIAGPGDIQLEQYRPYESPNKSLSDMHSTV